MTELLLCLKEDMDVLKLVRVCAMSGECATDSRDLGQPAPDGGGAALAT